MVEDHLEKTRRKIKERGFTTQKAIPRSGVYVFFSFDLVNSTQFKISYADSWPLIVTRFYDLVAAEVSTRFTSAILWKYVGDEVLYYKLLHSRKDLHALLPTAYAVLNSVIASLHQLNPETRPILSVKSTLWIAEAEYLPPSSAETARLTKRNIITSPSRIPEAKDRDFLGPDIDAGFRIAKHVERKRLIISAHLAAALYRERAQCSYIEKQLRIVSYESLKGVWNGRHYPIIWYEEDWANIKRTFLYDEPFTSTIIKKIRDGSDSSYSSIENIENVFVDLGKEDELSTLFSTLDATASSTSDNAVQIEIPPNKYSEVHCVAVCFNSEGKALIARRPSTKKRFANCWEFGCGQLKLGESFADCIVQSYREDFGADLDIPDNIVPVATFAIEDGTENRTIPGIIFVVTLNNPHEIANRFLRVKHSEIKWISVDDVQRLPIVECVPDLAQTFATAHVMWMNKIQTTN